jgi:hypothetical protein
LLLKNCAGYLRFFEIPKPDVFPTKLKILEAMKIYDILNPNFQGIGNATAMYLRP